MEGGGGHHADDRSVVGRAGEATEQGSAGETDGSAEDEEDAEATSKVEAMSACHGRWGGMVEKLPQSKHPGVSWSKVGTVDLALLLSKCHVSRTLPV